MLLLGSYLGLKAKRGNRHIEGSVFYLSKFYLYKPGFDLTYAWHRAKPNLTGSAVPVAEVYLVCWKRFEQAVIANTCKVTGALTNNCANDYKEQRGFLVIDRSIVWA